MNDIARRRILTPALLLPLLAASLSIPLTAQAPAASARSEASAPAAPRRPSYFVDPHFIDPSIILMSPPAQDSATTKAELALLHQIEQTRTPAQVAAAQADDKEEDIFIFKAILGDGFTPDALPLTAALSGQVRNDSGTYNATLKALYARPRPYNFDHTLHPVCKTDTEGSYPSGHSEAGYLLALTLVELVPEKHEQILARADDYTHNRLVCGVHYPSDIEASRRLAYTLFGYMMGTPKFKNGLAAARTELRQHLNLPALQ